MFFPVGPGIWNQIQLEIGLQTSKCQLLFDGGLSWRPQKSHGLLQPRAPFSGAARKAACLA